MKYILLSIIAAIVLVTILTIVFAPMVAGGLFLHAMNQPDTRPAKVQCEDSYKRIFAMPIERASDFKVYSTLNGWGDHDISWGFKADQVVFIDPARFKGGREGATSWQDIKDPGEQIFVRYDASTKDVFVRETDMKDQAP